MFVGKINFDNQFGKFFYFFIFMYLLFILLHFVFSGREGWVLQKLFPRGDL